MERRLLLFIYLSMFFITLSIGTYNPFIPLYAEGFGASYVDLGFIGMVYALPYMFLAGIVGFITDILGKGSFFLIGVSSCVLTAPLFLLSSNVSDIILVRIFGGVAYAFLWPTVEAILSTTSSTKERIKVMGEYSFSWALGFLLGPFIGGFILEKYGFTTLFSTSLIIGLIALFPAMYLLKNLKKSLVRKEKRTQNFLMIKNVVNLTFLTRLIQPAFVNFSYGFILSLLFTLFPAYLKNLGITPFQVGLLFTVFGLTRTITFLQSGIFSRICKEKSLLILALTIQAFSILVLVYVRELILLIVGIIMLGLAMGITSPVVISTASRISDGEKVGASIGLIETMLGAGMSIGPFVGGFAAEKLGEKFPYMVGFLLSLVSITLLTTTKKEKLIKCN
ncbi:MAG: MFS transporter [Candidatus Bathyarchaeota archaeon]